MRPTEIRVGALEDGANPFELSVTGTELGLVDEDEVVLAEPARVELEIVKVDRTLDIRGRVHGVAVGICSRCAGEARIDLDVSLRLIGKERRAGETVPVVDSEDLVYHDGNVLDLADPLRQIVLISVPMAPLCSEACRGLCPVCGTDLNVETCSCERKAPDNRWQALEELLDRERKKS